ncbi:MAG: aminomethyltransferase beta-barrel domain-containing protein, partial [Flavobacteriales bacterium]
TIAWDFDKAKTEAVGEHNGAHFFTIGQRKGLGVGGVEEPMYVLDKDTKNNVLYAGQGSNHPGLYRKGLFISPENIHWIREDMQLNVDEETEFDLRIRYRQPLQKGKLYRKKNGLHIVFDEAQRAIAPGQFAAWYMGDEVIGSGVIG